MFLCLYSICHCSYSQLSIISIHMAYHCHTTLQQEKVFQLLRNRHISPLSVYRLCSDWALLLCLCFRNDFIIDKDCLFSAGRRIRNDGNHSGGFDVLLFIFNDFLWLSSLGIFLSEWLKSKASYGFQRFSPWPSEKKRCRNCHSRTMLSSRYFSKCFPEEKMPNS